MITQRQFGLWMDSHNATIVGKEDPDNGQWKVIAHVKGEEVSPSPGGNNENNQKKTNQAKFFKEITSHLQNATLLHATGTGQVQEQFLHYLAASPQFKNTVTEESTAKRMSDESLVKFFSDKWN